MKNMTSKTQWYCPRCGNKIQLEYHSVISEYYESSVDKQMIVRHKCSNCRQESLLYRNKLEIVQIHIRLQPENKIEEEQDDSIQ